MPNLIKTAGKGILRLFSTIWSICTYPYRAIRSLLFIPIYPARVVFKPKHNIIIRYLLNRLRISEDFYNNIRWKFTAQYTEELLTLPAGVAP